MQRRDNCVAVLATLGIARRRRGAATWPAAGAELASLRGEAGQPFVDAAGVGGHAEAPVDLKGLI